jgi:DNA helicase-2/ATP-dependent DNA helicase PcrA
MQLLPGVGPVSAQQVLDHLAASSPPIAALPSAPPPARVGQDWTGLRDLVADLARGDLGWPSELERVRQW